MDQLLPLLCHFRYTFPFAAFPEIPSPLLDETIRYVSRSP